MRPYEGVFQSVAEGILDQIRILLPPLVIALAIFAIFLIIAFLVRWVLAKMIKGARLDRFLADTGLSNIFRTSGSVHGTPLIAGAAYWLILLGGALAALSVFGTALTSRIVEAGVFLFPKLITAGAILLVGFWFARYLGQSMLVWASNEEIPGARRLAAATRVLTSFVVIVVAADVLDFAPRVFFAAFVIMASGFAMALGLALGLGGRDAVRNYFERRAQHGRRKEEEADERPLWSHL